MLAPRHKINADVFAMTHGHFLPKCRHNVDQVPLPLVVSTFTDENDKDMRTLAPINALIKRQFTVHVIFNSG